MHTVRSAKGYGRGVLRGFPAALVESPPGPLLGPVAKPLPHSNKGRYLAVLMILGICGYAILQIWQTFFRYEAYGTVVGRTLEIHSPHEGLIRKVHVEDGDRVQRGQLLMSIDRISLRQQLDRLEGERQFASARQDSARVREIEFEIRRVIRGLEETTIAAPVDGIVLRCHRVAGELASLTEPVLTLLDARTLEVVVYLRQDSSGWLTAGDEVEVEMQSQPSPVRCRVARVDDRYLTAPNHIRRQYHADELLLPVHLQPLGDLPEMRVGAIAKLLPGRTSKPAVIAASRGMR